MMINIEEFKKNLIIKALQGKLTKQISSDGTALDVLSEIIKIKSTAKKKWTIPHVDKNDSPFDIPRTWTWCYLESISDSLGGKSNQIQSSEIKENGEIPVVSQGKKFIDGYTSFTNKVITDVPVVLFGDHTKVVKFINFPFVVGADGTKLLKPICLDNKFFYHLITYASFTIYDLGYSRHFSLLKKCPLPIPPLKEQTRIADKLDEIFAELDKIGEEQTKIETIKKELEAKILKSAIQGKLVEQKPEEGTGEDLFKSIRKEKQEMVNQGLIKREKPLPPIEEDEVPFDTPTTWKWTRLGNLLTVISGTSYEKSDVTNAGLRVLRGGNIQNDKLIITNCDLFLPINYLDPNKLIQEGDTIVVASTGSQELIGKPAFVTKTYTDTTIGAFLRICRPFVKEMGAFLGCVFQSSLYREHIRSKANGTNINNVKESYITELCVPLPPLEEQKRIVAKIEELLPLCRRN